MNVLKGDYRGESGALERGKMCVEKTDNGFVHAETGARLTAKEYVITGDMTGVEITSNTLAGEFLPDPGECERIGMEIVKL